VTTVINVKTVNLYSKLAKIVVSKSWSFRSFTKLDRKIALVHFY